MRFEIRCPKCGNLLYKGRGSGVTKCRKCKIVYRFNSRYADRNSKVLKGTELKGYELK